LWIGRPLESMKQRSEKKIPGFFYLLASLGFSLWLTGFLLHRYSLHHELTQNDVAAFERSLNDQSVKLSEAVRDFSERTNIETSEGDQFAIAREMAEQNPFDFFAWKNDTLRLWTSSSVPIPLVISDTNFRNSVLRLDNGWYQISTRKTGSTLFAGFFLIRSEYAFENDDLVNDFSELITPRPWGQIVQFETEFPVKDTEGKTQFYILPGDEPHLHNGLETGIFFCYLFAGLILVQLLISAFQKLLVKNPLILVVFPVALVCLRYLWLLSGYRGIFQDFELFNPELFASSSLSASLGDLIINVSVFFFLVHFLLKRTRNWFSSGNKKLKLVFFLIPMFFISFYAALQINDIIYSLVFDSKISFDLEQLFDLTIFSFISLAIIGAGFYAYFKFIQYIIIQLKKSGFEWNRLSFIWVLVSAAYIFFDQYRFDHSILTSFWPILLSGSLLWFEYKEKEPGFLHIVSMLAFVAFYAAFILQDYSTHNERNLRRVQAGEIARDKDPIAELDFDSALRKLASEAYINSFFASDDFYLHQMNEDLEEKYFRRLSENYDLKFFLFDANKKMVVDYRNYETRDYLRIQEIIEQSGVQSEICPNLFFVSDYTEKLIYLGVLPVTREDSLTGYLTVELRSKKFPDDIGLPSLLLESNNQAVEELKNYSMAKYVSGRLVNFKGSFDYPALEPDWLKTSDQFVEFGEYDHYVFQEQPGFITVLSRPVKSIWVLFTSFSYLTIVFGVLLLIPLAYNRLNRDVSFKGIRLKIKIQAVFVGLTLVSLVAFAIGAGTFVIRQKHESNKDLIREKIGSVGIEMESKFKDYDKLTPIESYYIEYLLQKFSYTFVTDINVYDKQGDLLASSQPKIYNRGLVSKKLNADAYYAIHIEHSKDFIHEEKIGELNFLSAYSPFYNKNGDFLAYLNVQYISRQGELERQISGFLLAIINIMVFMLGISTILSVTVSNRLTRPLKVIQERLKTTHIGSLTKPIQYEGTDEIGELVREYNQMVAELQLAFEKLGKSERETAWREMAKQVAHEIKNPLTPMRLSIQHLQRSIAVKDEDSRQKLERVTKSLIEQIDALSQIANEFSHFAKMPKANEMELNLSELVRNAASVFSEAETDNFSLSVDITKEAWIVADKDQLLRVFNNLFKNAIQAVSSKPDGKINVSLSEKESRFIVSVSDNGVGISNEERSRIFVPYFTTKTTGTGLGLAMSKQIVETMKGEIWFESTFGLGTTFFVAFPAKRQKD